MQVHPRLAHVFVFSFSQWVMVSLHDPIGTMTLLAGCRAAAAAAAAAVPPPTRLRSFKPSTVDYYRLCHDRQFMPEAYDADSDCVRLYR
jgi:hypothetical protein